MDESHMEHAARITQAAVDAEQARVRRALAAVAIPPDWDGSCPECGDDVPAERVRVTGAMLCVACKTAQEHRSRLMR